MCLIVIGWQIHPDFPLVVAANRDEFYARTSAPAGRWSEAPEVFGGRDLEAGGTWLGITETRRFAAVTNVREPNAKKGRLSRGYLPRNYLLSNIPAQHYVTAIEGAAFSGFNLLVADKNNLYYSSNRNASPQHLAPGIYGLSNHLLDTPWPKLVTARHRFAEALPALPKTNELFQMLADDELIADEHLPRTGVPLEWERRLSAIFVKSEKYDTCASTILTMSAEGIICMEERTFGPNGKPRQYSTISTGV